MTEQQLRQDLASCHHIIHYYGWDDLVATHLSARIPNTDHILITPHNVPFESVCASSLIRCDLEGKTIGDDVYAIMPQAQNIHTPIYKSRPEVMCAIHTHSVYGIAVASLECGFLFTNQQSLRFYNDVAYHDYNALALDNEGDEIVKSIGNKSVMVLRNHGLLAVADSIELAMYRLYYLEKSCEIQVKTLSTSKSITHIDESVCNQTYEQFKKVKSPREAFIALVARVDGEYKVNFRD